MSTKLSIRLTDEVGKLGDDKGFVGWPDNLEEVIDAVASLEAERDEAQNSANVWCDAHASLASKMFALQAERDAYRSEAERMQALYFASAAERTKLMDERDTLQDSLRNARREALEWAAGQCMMEDDAAAVELRIADELDKLEAENDHGK